MALYICAYDYDYDCHLITQPLTIPICPPGEYLPVTEIFFLSLYQQCQSAEEKTVPRSVQTEERICFLIIFLGQLL